MERFRDEQKNTASVHRRRRCPVFSRSINALVPLSPTPIQDLDDAPSTQGIQGRYATALFAASKKAGALDAVDKDLVQVREERGAEGARRTRLVMLPLSLTRSLSTHVCSIPSRSAPSPPPPPPSPPS